MPKPNSTFFPALHSLRAFAALWVMVFHVKGQTGLADIGIGWGDFFIDVSLFVSYGYLGVQLFFVLSAFLLGLHYFQADRNHWRYRGYITKRIARIYPAYLVQLVVLVVFSGWFGIKYSFAWSDLLSHLFLYFNLPPNYVQQYNGVWWTLPVEFGFYIILPLMAGLLLHVNWLWMYVVCLFFTLTYRWYIYKNYADSPDQLVAMIDLLPGELSVFAGGLICAWYYNNYHQASIPVHVGFFGSFIFSMLWIGYHSQHQPLYLKGSWLLYYWESINAVFFALFVFFLATFKQDKPYLITHPALLWLGEISYGIYLWHWPVLQCLFPFMKQGFKGMPLYWYTLGSTFCITIICATISYYLIEKPVI